MSTPYSIQLADGPGQPVVLSHALGLDHSMWTDWAATQQGLRPVLAYDHRGQGRSPITESPLSMESCVDDAIQLVEQWQHRPVVWLGLSQGGMVGQGLALRRPDLLSGLVLAHTAAVYSPEARAAWSSRIITVRHGGMAAIADLVTQRYLSEAYRTSHPQETSRLRERLLKNDPSGYAANCEAIANVDWLEQLHRITCTTLVIAGALDAGATPAMARAIHERIAGSHLEIFPEASHLSPLETPDEFNRAVGNFLRMLDKP